MPALASTLRFPNPTFAMRTFTVLLASLALSAPATVSLQSQLKLPQASPAATLTETIGTSTVAIEYHRPAVKGRVIWGGLVPYGEVWRTGANEATTLRFSDPVKVAGHDVPAGTYAFFAIPTAESWTLILNKQDKQWGAFSYDVARDLLRFDVKPTAVAHTEWLKYSIEPSSEHSAMVRLTWEKLAVEFPVEVDVDKLVLAQIDDAIAKAQPGDARVYVSAAKYYYDRELAPEKALAWLDKSLAIEDGFWPREYKARLYFRAGKKAEAIAELEKAIALAKGKAPQGYIDGLNKLLVEYRAP